LSATISRNWAVLLFYGYLLVTVLWADSSLVSFKRWFKDFGNVIVALVILTERNPQQAVRAVFVRCAYILLPLSVIFIRYFPELGRRYSRSGNLEITGVTTQKNSLGILVLICGLVLVWEWFERSKATRARQSRMERYLPLGLFAIGAYLLHLCDSKTSIVCLGVGLGVLASIKIPVLRKRVGALGLYILLAGAAFYVLDSIFGLRDNLIAGLGRDATLTGRTDVWRELLALKTDPIFGIGFCSLWSDKFYLEKLPYWVGASAHNGYLEMFIDGGMIAIFFLVIMLTAVGLRHNRQLSQGSNYALFRFAILLSIIIGDFAESHFGRMGPLWFTFLLTAIEAPMLRSAAPVRNFEDDFGVNHREPVFQPI